MTEHAYIFLRPCGHLAMVIADTPRTLRDSARDVRWALSNGLAMKRITADEVRGGAYRFCPRGCNRMEPALPPPEDEAAR